MACLSRCFIGMVKSADEAETLVVTLPGKPKAVKENFGILTR